MSRTRLFRRLASGGIATALSAVGLTAAFVAPAQANIHDVTPSFAFNNTDNVVIAFTPDESFVGLPTPSTPLVNTRQYRVLLTRQGNPIPPSACQSPPTSPDTACNSAHNTIVGTLLAETGDGQDPTDNTFYAEFDFNTGPGAAPGPANPGIYDLFFEETQANGLGGTTKVTDSCNACFVVLSGAPLALTNTSLPNARPGTTISPFTLNGDGFSRGTGIEVLFGGSVDPTVRLYNQDLNSSSADPNPDTGKQMTKELEVLASAPGGERDFRIFNTDGTSIVCARCFTVDSLFVDAVNPLAVDNRGLRRIAITGRRIQSGATASLIRFPTLAGQPDIPGTDLILTDNGTIQTISATFDMTGAAPGERAYLIKVTNPDGGIGTCPGSCRLSVAGLAPTATAVEPPSRPVGTDDAPESLIGTNLARGAAITFSNAGVTAAPGSVVYDSPTKLNFLVDVASNAPTGKVDVTVTNADGKAAVCTGCFEVTAAPASPDPSTSPTNPPAEDNGVYTPVNPARVLDTRDGTGGVRSPLGAGESRAFQVTGQGGVPAGATAVVFNLTAISPSASGFLTAFPTGSSRPNASNVNFVRGDVVANLVKVKVGTDGKVSLFNNSGTTNVAADVVGYYSKASGSATPSESAAPSASASGSAAPSASASAAPTSAAPTTAPTTAESRYSAIVPVRILDTRDGNGGSNRPIGPGESRVLQVTGRAGVPADATAVVVNLTAITPTASGFLTAFPTGTTRPVASNINFRNGQVIANLAIVRIGDGGKISIYNNSGDTNAAGDVVGYFSPTTNAASYTPLQPQRILDTRDGSNSVARPIGPGESRSFRVTGLAGVPTNATAVTFNLTAIAGTNAGFLTAYPAGSARPLASNVNFVRGDVRPNLVIVKVGNGGQVTLFNNSGSTHAVADIVGYFGTFNPSATPTASPSPSASVSATSSATPSTSATSTPSASTSTSTTAAPLIPIAMRTPVQQSRAGSNGALALAAFAFLGLAAGAVRPRRTAPKYVRKH